MAYSYFSPAFRRADMSCSENAESLKGIILQSNQCLEIYLGYATALSSRL